jgi:hypothetical protein
LLALSVGGRSAPPPTLPFFSPVQTGLPRELAKLLTRATQPCLVSPGGGEWIVLIKALSLSAVTRGTYYKAFVWLCVCLLLQARPVCYCCVCLFFYCRTYYKAVRVCVFITAVRVCSREVSRVTVKSLVRLSHEHLDDSCSVVQFMLETWALRVSHEHDRVDARGDATLGAGKRLLTDARAFL